ncbi:MAG: TonB-dependent receptor [Candidatus Solibacter sp.]|nr:TonB-dependent receptor [Candidatus Solibacter sp.]
MSNVRRTSVICGLLFLASSACAGASIAGRVHDADGRPLKDVAVSAEAKAKVYSNDKGEFSLEPGGAADTVGLLFELPGYYPESLLYEVKGGASLDVALTPRAVVKEEVKVVASRLDLTVADVPAATSVVGLEMLERMPRGIAVEEALASVPGVKIDNQANGERVHLSIRGQGILSERGIRGIQVLYDGVPLNDPSGFAPDLYDIDWAGVQEVSVVRGPVAFLYGGGSAAGVIDVRTRGAEFTPFHGALAGEGGSNGFYKTRGELSGSGAGIAYLISGSRTAGDGYREHSAFWGNNVYGRLGLRPTRRLRLNPYVIGTGFFNENAEGLNLAWGYPSDKWWTMPNPDSLTYNEYQLTHRVLGGVSGEWDAAERQRLSFQFYTRRTTYKEPVPSSVEHRELTAPGGSVQYQGEWRAGRARNTFSAGTDLDWQFTTSLRHPNLGNAAEDASLLSNADITQNRVGAFFTDRLAIGDKWTLLGSLRLDRIRNGFDDKLKAGGLNLSGNANFSRVTGRLGATRSISKTSSLYASWGQGFLPPATEELYANPAALGGFNRSLKPATSTGVEVGARGSALARLFWDAALFRLDTRRDFERYRVASRPLETFYGNAGESRRYGLESSVRWLLARGAFETAAYTYSNFTYTKYDSLTYPGNLTGKDLPNSPRQQLYVDVSWEFARNWTISAGTQAWGRAFIDPTNKTWIDGYGLLNARFSRSWQHRGFGCTLFVAGRNLTANRYIAFTEPDPDGNSYQPGASREIFGGIQLRF